MKITGELKDKVDQTATLEDAKDIIAQAGKKLTDDEVSEAAGGAGVDDDPNLLNDAFKGPLRYGFNGPQTGSGEPKRHQGKAKEELV